MYSDTVKRICLLNLKNRHDTDDVFQNVFLKYMQSDTIFESDEHEKAWFIRVTLNECKDFFKSFSRSKVVSIDEIIEPSEEMDTESMELLDEVLKLPKKYKEVIYLFYYEGYNAVEIGQILNKNVNTIYTLMSRAKEMLKCNLGGEADGK